MNDSSSNAQGKGPGVYAARKSGAATVPQTTATPYKAIDLADVVSGQFDDEEASEEVAQDLGHVFIAIDATKLQALAQKYLKNPTVVVIKEQVAEQK